MIKSMPWIGKAITLLLAAVLHTDIAMAQDCALKLQEAQAHFDRGRVELVPDLIVPCLNSSGFSREDGLLAYKLLIQSLLLDEKIDAAEEKILSFLYKNPEYETTAADYSGFVYLRNKYQVLPKLYLSARAGLNFTLLSGLTEQTVSSLPADNNYSREPLNMYAGIEAAVPMWRKFSASAGVGYSSSSFMNTEDILGFGTVTYNETQQRIEIPLSVIYTLSRWRGIDIYARAGAGYALNLSTEATASFTTSDVNNGFNRTGEALNRNDSRIRGDIFLHAGAGGRLKIPRGYITAEIRALAGVRNQVTGAAVPANLEYFYFYTDDNFRINIAGITVGYTYIFYKPSKLQGQ